MICCDKTLSELWNLRGSVDPVSFEELKEQSSDTAFTAISTIKRLQEENERYEKALKEIKNICGAYSPLTQGYRFTHQIQKIVEGLLKE